MRSANRGYRTDASRPEKAHLRYSAADQAKALGSSQGEDQGLMDSDEERAKRKIKPDWHDLPPWMKMGVM